ncbi:MAG: spore coat associated protein CotJA [Anaerovoracaceae bacterium]|nr:spore coat associated protein CotJA [Bacillota bacterium]MDY5770936.1 spore coat associated protein CotJA [Anaerovoracaceae bacterium]
MIKDPYIGMPLTMGSMQVPCESCNNNRPPANRPGRPGESGSQNQEMGAGAAIGCGPLGDSPELSWQGGSAGNAMGFDSMYLGSLPLASAYVPFQQWKTTYSLDTGLERGTIFPELDLPFEGYMRKGGMRR